jgi:hypothetical protein
MVKEERSSVTVTFTEDIGITVENVLVEDVEQFTQDLMQRCVNAYKAKQIVDALATGQLIRAINLFNSCGDCPVAEEIVQDNREEAESKLVREREEEDRPYT